MSAKNPGDGGYGFGGVIKADGQKAVEMLQRAYPSELLARSKRTLRLQNWILPSNCGPTTQRAKEILRSPGIGRPLSHNRNSIRNYLT
jgi:hypothetical protein